MVLRSGTRELDPSRRLRVEEAGCREEEEEACLLQGWYNAVSRWEAPQKSVEQWDIHQVRQKLLPQMSMTLS